MKKEIKKQVDEGMYRFTQLYCRERSVEIAYAVDYVTRHYLSSEDLSSRQYNVIWRYVAKKLKFYGFKLKE